ncbi:hypothetical protein LTR94_034705, partial [Friedmanniomyces endolithicus]
MGNGRRPIHARQRRRHHAHEAELAGGGPERRPKTRAQPAGQADVVGMTMRRDQAQQRPAIQPPGQYLFPGGAGGVGAGAGIDQAPAAPLL